MRASMMCSTQRLRACGSLLLSFILLSGCAYMHHNLREVDERRLLRSGQMPAGAIERVIEREGVGVVVNLRGANPGEAWYDEEVAACQAAGAAHVDLRWSMKCIPEPESLERLVAILDEGPHPVLVHCQGGVHRAGVASACYVLLQGGSVDDAREQFTLFFNDAPIGRLLDLYAGSALPFRAWVREEYPGIYAREERR